jgi:predicted flap endonuclease-1-like 5' DNA nuclease
MRSDFETVGLSGIISAGLMERPNGKRGIYDMLDRSTKTLIAVFTLVAATFLVSEHIISADPIEDWLLAGLLFVISLGFWAWLWQENQPTGSALTVMDSSNGNAPTSSFGSIREWTLTPQAPVDILAPHDRAVVTGAGEVALSEGGPVALDTLEVNAAKSTSEIINAASTPDDDVLEAMVSTPVLRSDEDTDDDYLEAMVSTPVLRSDEDAEDDGTVAVASDAVVVDAGMAADQITVTTSGDADEVVVQTADIPGDEIRVEVVPSDSVPSAQEATEAVVEAVGDAPVAQAVSSAEGASAAVADPVVDAEAVIVPPAPSSENPVPEVAEAPQETEIVAVPVNTGAGDDLTIIEGIGPKYDAALKAAGITTFEMVAASTVESLEEAVRGTALRRPTSIDTWAEQARLLAAGDRAGFDEYVAKMKSARRLED